MKLSHRRVKKARKKTSPNSYDRMLVRRAEVKSRKKATQAIVAIGTRLLLGNARLQVAQIVSQPRPIEIAKEDFALQKAQAIMQLMIDTAQAVAKFTSFPPVTK
jgi:hypothetical protein